MAEYWIPGVPQVSGVNLIAWAASHEASVVHVWAPWVSHDQTAAINFQMAMAAPDQSVVAIPVAACRFDDPENFEFMRQGKVATVPTFLIFKFGEEACRVEGLASDQQYRSFLQRLTEKQPEGNSKAGKRKGWKHKGDATH